MRTRPPPTAGGQLRGRRTHHARPPGVEVILSPKRPRPQLDRTSGISLTEVALANAVTRRPGSN